MFHCNGWCLTWGVTAAGGTHVCLRKVEPGAHLEAVRRRGRHALQRRPDDPHQHRQPRRRPSARAARHGADRRLAALADAAREDARAQPAPDPPLRPDRDLRARHGLQLAAASGTSSSSTSRPRSSRARATPTTAPTSCAWSTTTCSDVPRDGETIGEVVMRGNSVMRRLPQQARGDRGGLQGRLVPLRRPRGRGTPTATSSCATAPRTSSSRAARTSRASRSSRRSSEPPGGARGGRRRHARREVGRAAEGVRRAEVRRGRSSEDDIDRVLPRAPRAASSARRPSSSASCRAPATGKVQKFVLREREWAGHEKAIG